MSKKRSIYYALYLFLLTGICLILAMEGVEAATYNFYFNNTEQGANSNASPTLTVRDGKKVAPPVEIGESAPQASVTTTEADSPLIPNPLPPAPWGVEKPASKAPAPAPAPATEVDDEDAFDAPEGEAVAPASPGQYPAFEPAAERPRRAAPLAPRGVALDMTVPQLLAALFQPVSR